MPRPTTLSVTLDLGNELPPAVTKSDEIRRDLFIERTICSVLEGLLHWHTDWLLSMRGPESTWLQTAQKRT